MGKAKKPEKSSGKSSEPVLVPQKHGGALLTGGVPGHEGGGGRPPSKVKAALRLEFDKRIPTLAEVADDAEAPMNERLRAIDMMAKYSDLDLNVDIELVEKLGAVVAAEIQDEDVMMRIKEQWLEIVASRIALG